MHDFFSCGKRAPMKNSNRCLLLQCQILQNMWEEENSLDQAAHLYKLDTVIVTSISWMLFWIQKNFVTQQIHRDLYSMWLTIFYQIWNIPDNNLTELDVINLALSLKVMDTHIISLSRTMVSKFHLLHFLSPLN